MLREAKMIILWAKTRRRRETGMTLEPQTDSSRWAEESSLDSAENWTAENYIAEIQHPEWRRSLPGV